MKLEKASFLAGSWTVGSIADAGALRRLPGLAGNGTCDVVEYRADCWVDAAAEAAEAMARTPLPALLTVRAAEEGGRAALSAEARRGLYHRLLPQAALVDVEVASLPELDDVVQAARDQGVIVVASLHDFTATPTRDLLRSAVERAMAGGADLVKFATTVKTTADLAVLGSLLEEQGHVPLSVMGMGPLGRVSRLLFGQLGSVLNYGYLDAATVPGQWPAGHLRQLIAQLRSSAH